MLRRTLLKWLSSTSLIFLLPRWARGQAEHLSAGASATMSEVAAVVLPASLGLTQTAKITALFQQWIADYHAGADAGYGYGFPLPRTLGPNPSSHYDDQLRRLGAAAAEKGSTFAALDKAGKRAVIEAAIVQAGVTSIPPHPEGKHVATDMMSFFYHSSAGEDFCYNAAIQRDSCRGLSTSGARPSALR